MKEFENIRGRSIVKKEIIRVKAKEKAEFAKFLKPEEEVLVCNCLIKTQQVSNVLITGVIYPSLGWEHVLVRTERRYPTYREMIQAKGLFWNENEVAFQVYPSNLQNVNNEEYTLHLWRNSEIERDNEDLLIESIQNCYGKAKEEFDGTKKVILVKDAYGKRILVYGPMCWFTWEELAAEKQRFWNFKEAAIQFHLTEKVDDNSKYITMLWDTKKFLLPPKELV